MDSQPQSRPRAGRFAQQQPGGYLPVEQPPLQQGGGYLPTEQPPLQQQGGFGTHGAFMGYNGPMPGTPEFLAARAAGQHPVLDWFRSQRPSRLGDIAGVGQGVRLADLGWAGVGQQMQQF